MSTQIRKLSIAVDAFMDQTYPGWADQGQYLSVWEDKFAELIIKDCASICEINGSTYKYSFTPAKARLAESTSKYCGTMIKKHFGVDE